MSIVKSFLSPSTDATQSAYAASLLRVSLGVVLLAHGLLKVLIFGLQGTGEFFNSIGFAAWLVYPVVALEVGGGLLLIAGLWVRAVATLSAVLLALTVFVHAPNGWVFSSANGGWEYPLFLTLVAVAVALAGAGRFAVKWPVRQPETTPKTATAAT